jgi:tetratricopeptide (TPR) repeat protein
MKPRPGLEADAMRRIRVLACWLMFFALLPQLRAQDSAAPLINAYVVLSPHIEKARTAFRSDRLDQCEKEALFCLSKLPDHQEAHFLMSLVLYKRGEYAPALEHLQEAESGYVEIARALSLAGRQNLQKQSDEMVQLADEIEDLAGAYAASKSHGSGMGEKYDRAALDAKQELAKAEGERNMSASQKDAAAIPALYRYWHGNVLFMLKHPAEAEAQYRQALAADPDFRDTYNNLINLLYLGGRADEARAVLAQAEAHKAKVHPELKKAVLGKDGPSD